MPKSAIQDHKAFAEGERCPHCGGETQVGFGLAGGGYGPYMFCDTCEVVTSKSPEED